MIINHRKNSKYGIGTIHKSSNGTLVEVLDFIDKDRRLINILEDGSIDECFTKSIKLGTVRNKNTYKKLYEVGFTSENIKNEKFEVIELLSEGKRVVKFELDDFITEVKTSDIRDGLVKNPNTNKFAVGSKHKTKKGYVVTIIEYIDYYYRIVEFENGYKTKVTISNLKQGVLKNPYHPSIFGFGYFGTDNCKITYIDAYNRWRGIIQRTCLKRNDSYKNTTIDSMWLNFSNFEKWYETTYPFHINNIKFQIDKDLLQQHIDNKIYSEHTCIWLPSNINIFISHRYKKDEFRACYDKSRNKWIGVTCDFITGRDIRKRFNTQEEAHEFYLKVRAEQAEKAKDYLRSLDYLPEEIIQLVN